MDHATIRANGAAFHVARTGSGPPLLLLHGWPEFWLTWKPVMARLADRYTLIAPDLRGFGDSDKPQGPYGPDQHTDDMLALLDALGIDRACVVGHDVGGAVMQPLARKAPERIAGLFFFDFVYPGIGPRMAAPDRLNHIWYQSFHQMEMAPALVGATRDSCRTYIGHFLHNWTHRKAAFDDVDRGFRRQFLQARQPRRRLRALPRITRGTREDDAGRSAHAAADRRADLHPMGRARPAVSL
ncbi:pimeloyl-ACP methyl ester carboxylesterase [Bradyrhizobium macuxiense]|uniref:Pimeloyl-ACP methyl ester carboxylesterase n=1 Tax=Bradyrhizobium macuxiense TaxID=1755647 RepID=A0A560LK07_9BRAD|nr:alpha/beta fold hydrolase [Bradyrhizobium macuxiense]TWB93630.1 pimeloyl-ACP methyl ester carboxylesterase [Bradyrhizobium macuxiense]